MGGSIEGGDEGRRAVVHDLGRTLAAYDQDLWDHSSHVADLAALLAAQLDLDHPDRLFAAHAGLVHDLGKLGLPRAILNKPGPLTAEERRAVDRHCAVGAEMLLTISPQLAPLAEAVRSHHERWDGGGYPDGLAGAKIPRSGRVLAVVDVYSALTQPRLYRRDVFSPAAARGYLEENAGTQFDPECVAASLEVLRAYEMGRRQF